MGIQTDKVRFNVRGKIFETTATTLASAPRNSVFGSMFDDEWNLQANKEEYFIDRNPDFFPVLLDLLGTGELHLPSDVSKKLLYREAHYYGLLEHVRTAKFCKLDCNRLTLASSVRGQASGNYTAISASPIGGCAVAHSKIVRLYDWTLEEHPPINFNYQIVNNIEDSGLALFNSSTGDLRHNFELNHKNHVNSFTAGALCFNSDAKIAASCGIGTGIYGCGIWDQVTGKQTDFFHENFRFPLFSYPDRIQWLSGSKCGIRWNWENHRRHKYIEPRYPRLKLHVGQLFSCVNDSLSMFSGPDWYLTSSLGRSSGGGAIRDFSIGGDRLFALHSCWKWFWG
ncbi:hypothetical protein MKX03_003532 [Papaver bracteatum]|nr:hypothetical protein MKX03_003532 [Papaver bracteatum]